jgi:hypothetical protein
LNFCKRGEAVTKVPAMGRGPADMPRKPPPRKAASDTVATVPSAMSAIPPAIEKWSNPRRWSGLRIAHLRKKSHD